MIASPLQAAIDEIHSVPSPTGEAWRQSVGANVVARIDGFLEELERLHLSGGERVPNDLGERLATFIETLPPAWPTAFPIRTRIAYVIEDLFTLQEHALDLKTGSRKALRSVDRAIDSEDDGGPIARRAERRRRASRMQLVG